jgi:predicted secreted protein
MSEVLVNIFFYIITWWVVLFAVLPWGVRRVENPVEGHDPGAPERPHLARKLAATFLISFVIWAIGFFIVKHFGLSLVDFRDK